MSRPGMNRGFPDGLVGKESAYNAGDTGDSSSISGSGRSPGGGNGNPLQYSCLGNPMDREAWWAAVHRVTKESDMTEQLNNNRIYLHLLCARGCMVLEHSPTARHPGM